MYNYFIYGLNINSEIRLYQLDQTDAVPGDAVVHCGTIRQDIADDLAKGINSKMSKTEVWFRNDTGIFAVKNGNEILIDAGEDATEEAMASFVLGWCMAFLFQQRGTSAIHCSALEMNGKAVLIAGGSGAGKSTLTMSLLRAGHRYLADDIAMVDLEHDLLIQPAFPQQKVCRNVAESMNPESLFYIDERKDKFAYNNVDDFCPQPRHLSSIFLLRKYDGEEVSIKPLTGIQKWNGIMKNLFLLDAYKAFGIPPEESMRCLKIAEKTDVYEICRPTDKDTLEEICAAVIRLTEKG